MTLPGQSSSAGNLVPATLIRRYKRFLADVKLATGQEITVHCPNTGSMKHCMEDGGRVLLSTSDNPKRKYRHTWEFTHTRAGHYIGINTTRANQIVARALDDERIAELTDYTEQIPEVRYGSENSRIDFLLSAEGRPDCYLEVKSVTLLEPPVRSGRGYFPDAVSARGTKHLRELMAVAAEGSRAVLLFCVQHSGIRSVQAATHIDPAYAAALPEAVGAGVEVLAYKTRFAGLQTALWRRIPFVVRS